MFRNHKKIAPKAGKAGVVGMPTTPMRFILHVSKPHARWMFGAFLAVTIGDAVGSSIPYVMRHIIDAATAVVTGGGPMSDVWFYVGLYFLATVIMFTGWRASGFIGMEWITRLNATAYQRLFGYLSRHSFGYFTNRFAGSLSSKLGHASEGAQALSEGMLWNYYPAILSFIVAFGFITASNMVAGAAFAMLVVVMIPLNIYFTSLRRPHVVAYAEQATKARGYGVDAITNMSAVRQFARRAYESERFSRHITFMRLLNIKQWRFSEWSLTANNVIVILFEAMVLVVAVRAWTVGELTIGELVMITTLMLNIRREIIFIGGMMNGFIRRYSEIEEGLSDIVRPYEIVDAKDAVELRVVNGVIEWKKVSFGFGAGNVFDGFDLSIPGGQRVGLVGTSGAGKSTFVSLLLRHHDIASGQILIDGQDIAKVAQDSLREHIAVVPQEPMLFHRSIMDNIRYGKLDATDAEIIAVAKKAQAHEFITALAHGYDTLVGERGIKLSGGQRQRIAIARAMLKDAPILVLDEATSALDSESEVAIQEALHKLMDKKTVVAIAHRLSTLREMDRLIVLEEGKVVEDGTHDELIALGGRYARLWEHQAGGFLVE